MMYVCRNPSCMAFNSEVEDSSTDHWPVCRLCGKRLKGLAPGVVFTGEISGRYVRRGFGGDRLPDGGHFAWRVRSSRSGVPEKVWIGTWSDQRRYIREEGLMDPGDLPRYATISSDGRKIVEISESEARDIHDFIMSGNKLPVSRPTDPEGVKVTREKAPESLEQP